jgi:hypothetical protein
MNSIRGGRPVGEPRHRGPARLRFQKIVTTGETATARVARDEWTLAVKRRETSEATY